MTYRHAPYAMLDDDDGAGYLDAAALFDDLDRADDSDAYALDLLADTGDA